MIDVGWFLPADAGLWLAVTFAALCAASILLEPFLHLYQAEGYCAGGMLRALQTRAAMQDMAWQMAVVAMGMVGWWLGPVAFSSFAGPMAAPLGLSALMLASAMAVATIRSSRPHKKPFARTLRVCRLVAWAQIPPLVIMALLALLGKPAVAVASVLFFVIWTPFWVALAGIMAWPLERAIQAGYARKAKRKLASIPGLTVIGVTGSYGKTSAKFILQSILSQEFRTVSTPHSYNTPM
nr:UDP-N-acetylmuramoyl-tripeptide--D-alanyl-D-alanine ligase [bacterium]